jgi:hypothetical protein
MGRKSKQAEVTVLVQSYLRQGETLAPDQCILDVKHVAQAIGVSRTSLYKYGLADEIRDAAKRQQKYANLSPAEARRSRWRDLIRQLRVELAVAEERNKSLLRCLQLVEANAARLGIDPEELFVPLPKPDRSMPITGHNSV